MQKTNNQLRHFSPTIERISRPKIDTSQQTPWLRFLNRVVATGGAFVVLGCALVGGGAEHLKPADDYTATPPSTWRKISRNESDQAYRLSSGGVVTLVTSCNREDDVKLEALTRQLTIGLRKVEWQEQKAHGPGLLSALRGTYQGTPMYLMLYVAQHAHCVFDLSMMKPSPLNQTDRSEFFSFIDTLRFSPSEK